MFTVLFDFFLNSLTAAVAEAEKHVSTAPDAYALAAVACAMTGVKAETAYQQMPEMHPRTVRRVVSGAVRMCMSDVVEEEGVHKDTTDSAVLVEVQQLAEKAKVRPMVAMSAVTRYLNAPARVCKVLQDIQALQDAQCKVWNPTGLFTRLMRSGQDVKLPDRVTAKRAEALQVETEKAAKPVPVPGMLVKLYGEVCSIIEVTRQFALVRTTLDDIRVPVDSLRFVQT